MANDDKSIHHIRQSLPLLQRVIYMNTGSVGPLPEKTIQAIHESQLVEPQVSGFGNKTIQNKKNQGEIARGLIGELIGASADEIVITNNTTQGINIVTTGLNWNVGDEVITTNMEHSAVLLPLFQLSNRYGVVIKKIQWDSNLLKELKGQINERTRLVVVSHVSYSTGELLCLNEVVDLAHKHNIPVLVDGAQAVGAIPVNMKELKADFYSFPGQKWLCGPEGTGALYINKNRLEDLMLTFIGYNSVQNFDSKGLFSVHDSAKRFEIGSIYLPAVTGQYTSLYWLIREIGMKWILDRSRKLGEIMRNELLGIQGLTLLTPIKAGGLSSFRVEGIRSQLLARILAYKGIIVRTIPELDCVRTSTAFFNTEEEIETLIKAIKEENNK